MSSCETENHIFSALIRPLMNYVSVVWHTGSKQDLGKVFLSQKRVGRVILDATPRAYSVTLFNELGWIPFYEEAKIFKCCILYRRIQNNVPDYLINAWTLSSQIHSRENRYSNLNYICPKYNRVTEGGRTFNVTAVKL